MSRGGLDPKAIRERTVLRLYVAGPAPNSQLARAHLKAFLGEHADRPVELEIIDVLANPERGLKDGILVTPTLVRLRPAPQQQVVGNLRNRAALAAGIGFPVIRAHHEK
jgi:circadian clock protein KaiB